MIRWIVKIILFPISLLLSILTAFLTFLLGIGTTIGFLVSPYGIPMVGAAVIAFLQGINEAIKSI